MIPTSAGVMRLAWRRGEADKVIDVPPWKNHFQFAF